MRAKGIVAIVSMDAAENAREIAGFTHPTNNNPHYHGIFTSHLLKGQEGEATNTGAITFSGLLDYMKEKMQNEKQQQLQELTIGDAGITDLVISLAPENVLRDYIPKLIASCKTFSNKNIYSVRDGAEKIKELDDYETYRKEAKKCKALISNHLQTQAKKIV